MASASTAAAAAESTATQSVVVVTITSSQDNTPATVAPVVVTAYSTVQYTPTTSAATTSVRATPTPSATAEKASSGGGGLGSAGTIAIAVAVPVVVIAALLILGFFLWRRRKRNRSDLAQRKAEHDQYAFHPNEAPYPQSSMTQYGQATNGTQSFGPQAYRGWQPTDTSGPPLINNTSGFQPGRSAAVGVGAGVATGAGALSLATSSTAAASDYRRSSYLEKPTIPALDNMDDLESVDGDSSRPQNWQALSPGNGSPPLDALNSGSPTSNYSHADDQPTQATMNQGYSSRSSRLLPSLQPGHQRPVSNAVRNQYYLD